MNFRSKYVNRETTTDDWYLTQEENYISSATESTQWLKSVRSRSVLCQCWTWTAHIALNFEDCLFATAGTVASAAYSVLQLARQKSTLLPWYWSTKRDTKTRSHWEFSALPFYLVFLLSRDARESINLLRIEIFFLFLRKCVKKFNFYSYLRKCAYSILHSISTVIVYGRETLVIYW